MLCRRVRARGHWSLYQMVCRPKALSLHEITHIHIPEGPSASPGGPRCSRAGPTHLLAATGFGVGAGVASLPAPKTAHTFSHHLADSHSSMHLAIFVSISCLERLLPKNSRKWPSGSMRYLWRGGEGAVADTEAAEVAEKEVE